MKMNRLFIIVVLVLTTICAAAQDQQRGPGNRPNGGPGGFAPKLDGVWQMCNLAADANGQPQLSFLPVLRVFNDEASYQNIAIPDQGGCYVTTQNKIEKTSDSTYTESPMRMRPDAEQEVKKTEVKYRFRGAMWLTLTYTEEGKTEPTTELWMRVRPQGRGGQGGPQAGDRRPGEGRPQGMRGQGGGRSRQNLQANPFEQNGGGGSISEADD